MQRLSLRPQGTAEPDAAGRIRGSLRTRLVLTFSATLAALLAVNAAYLLSTARQRLRERLEGDAHRFATLATRPLCEAFDAYFQSGFFKFRQRVDDLLAGVPDVTGIEIADAQGPVLFDSRSESKTPAWPPGPARTLSGERLAAARRVRPTDIRGESLASFEIVVPYVEDWGRHRLSVVYHVSYASVRSQFRQTLVRTLLLVLVSISAASLLGLALARRLTRPLTQLTAGVQDVARGNFDQRLDIRSGDELEAVAGAFNDMAARLSQTIGELERRNAELERFTYTVSHDLRSPLVTVRGFLGFLEKEVKSGDVERAQEDIGRIRAATETMDRLLKELLDLSRIGRVANPPEPVPLGELAAHALELLAGRLGERKVQVEVQKDLPILFGDRARLLEVVQNLVDNAAKFMGPQARPRIVIGARPGPDGPVCFVEDNGIGIEAKHSERVFGLFERLDASIEGTGVGLAVVKRVIETHGGRVWVESAGSGRGSTFCFTLPMVRDGCRER